METTPGIPGELHASIHPTSDADIILHPENSGPPKGKTLQVISKGIPPEEMSDTDLDEELQHPKHPIKSQDKEEGEWTDTDEDDVPPLVDSLFLMKNPRGKNYHQILGMILHLIYRKS